LITVRIDKNFDNLLFPQMLVANSHRGKNVGVFTFECQVEVLIIPQHFGFCPRDGQTGAVIQKEWPCASGGPPGGFIKDPVDENRPSSTLNRIETDGWYWRGRAEAAGKRYHVPRTRGRQTNNSERRRGRVYWC